MATFDVAKLLNKITQDIPGINTVLKALAKWDVSALSDVPDGAMQATTDTNNRLTIKKKVSGSYTPVAKLMHDVDTVDGYHASTGAAANTVAVRNASGALPGNITGNAATADTAVALAAGAVVPVNQGGTGATTASQARANLGAANDAVFTAHIAKQASPSVEGHVKLDALAADGSNTAAPGGYGLGMPGAKQIPANTDLDSIVLPGFYSCKTDSAAGQLLNCPTARAFSMLVEHGGYGPTQTLHTFDNALRYRRTKVNANSFSGWAQVPGGISDSTSTTSSTIAASATAVKAVNDSLGQVQVQGAASWSADSAPYPINAQVYHNGKQWLALRANSAKPVEGADWSAIGTAATANLTTSNTDGTAGRVLKVGDGGWMGQGVHQVEPLGYPTSIKDITNQTKVIRADSVDNGVSRYAAGIHFATPNTWGRLRVNHYVPLAWVQGGVASEGTGWTSRVVLSDNLLQTTGSSTVFPMSQKAVTDALKDVVNKEYVDNLLGFKTQVGVFTVSGTYTAPFDAIGIITLVGGGGGGAADNKGGSHFGGGAGAVQRQTVRLSKSTQFPVIIGAGGAGGVNGANEWGSTGGASRFMDITAPAGGGGGSGAELADRTYGVRCLPSNFIGGGSTGTGNHGGHGGFIHGLGSLGVPIIEATSTITARAGVGYGAGGAGGGSRIHGGRGASGLCIIIAIPI